MFYEKGTYKAFLGLFSRRGYAILLI